MPDPQFSDESMPTHAERDAYPIEPSVVDADGDFEPTLEDSRVGAQQTEFDPTAGVPASEEQDDGQLGVTLSAADLLEEARDKLDDLRWASGAHDDIADDESPDDTPEEPEPVGEVEHLTPEELAADVKLRADKKKLNRQLIDSDGGETEELGPRRAEARWADAGFSDRSDHVSVFQDTDPTLDDDPLTESDRAEIAHDNAVEFFETMEQEEAAQRRDLERGIPKPGSKGEQILFKEAQRRRQTAIDNARKWFDNEAD